MRNGRSLWEPVPPWLLYIYQERSSVKFDEHGNDSFRTIDDEVSDALRIPKVPEG